MSQCLCVFFSLLTLCLLFFTLRVLRCFPPVNIFPGGIFPAGPGFPADAGVILIGPAIYCRTNAESEIIGCLKILKCMWLILRIMTYMSNDSLMFIDTI